MIKENNCLSNTEINLLKKMIGKRLIKVEAAIAAPPNVAWNTVRLHGNECSVDISCLLKDVLINEDNETEEFGVISVVEAPDKKLDVETISSDTEEITLCKEIRGIEIINSRIISYYDEIAFCEKCFTKAIVFWFEDECMVIDKLAWFDEMLRVIFGENLDDLLYDESQDWEDEGEEDGASFEYTTERFHL